MTTDEPVDLSRVRNERAEPGAEFRRRDEFGRTLYCFALEYEMAGSRWGVDVWAYDWADADARVAGMRASLRVLGKVFEEVPG